MTDDEIREYMDARLKILVDAAAVQLATTMGVAVEEAIKVTERRTVDYTNEREADVRRYVWEREQDTRQLLDQRLAGASQYVTNLAAAALAESEKRNGEKFAALRDSLIAANSQIVIDMNDTLRGIHARLSVLEQIAGIVKGGLGPRYVPFDVLTVVGNLSAALADATRKLTGEND